MIEGMEGYPELAFGTPRKLPKAKSLQGRVVVLDIAFAAKAGGASFETVTQPFIDGLGARLACWIDHHDHDRHKDFSDDPRFILRTKAEHGACPELVTPERVAQAGAIDTVVCHTDFDGLCSAAKWILGGEEPYEGADDDARAIDTRMGTPSKLASTLDRALRAKPNDNGLRGTIVRFLAGRLQDKSAFESIEKVAEGLKAIEAETRRLAKSYRTEGRLAIVDARPRKGRYDKTLLLLMGQERAEISVVHDESTVTAAARFDSGVNLLELLGMEGGMPTRVSVGAKHLEDVLVKLQK